MKKTNVYFFHSVSWSFKSLITGAFLLVFMAFANHGSAQLAAPTPQDVLPPLKDKADCVAIAQVESQKVSDAIKLDPQNMDLRMKWDAYAYIIMNAPEPTFDIYLLMAQMYGVIHKDNDGTTTHSYGFYAKSWNSVYREVVDKFKRT